MSSSTMVRLLILFLLGGLAGWGLAPRLRVESASATGSTALAVTNSESRPRRELPRSAADFSRWIEERAARYDPASASPNNSHEEELGGWSLEEIRTALAQGLLDPGLVREGPVLHAVLALLGEWTKRDPDAAWAWLSALPAGPTRSRLSSAIAYNWPMERAEEGLELVLANVEDFKATRGYTYALLLKRAAESAAKRGPLALDELVARCDQSGLSSPYMDFPPGFDFAGLIRAPHISEQLSHTGIPTNFVAAGWLTANPDAAVPGLLALDRQQGRDPGFHLFNGLRNGKEEQARKVGAALGKLPPEEQRQIFGGEMKSFLGEPSTLRSLIEGLPDPGIRAEASLAAAARLLSRESMTEALAFIDAGSDPADRLANLEAQLAARTQPPQNGMTFATVDKVRATLASWSATPEDIERLLKAMQPQSE